MANLYEIRQRAQQVEAQQQFAPEAPAQAGKSYRDIYRAVFAYHERHNPPQLTGEYWREAANDISMVSAAFNHDPFILALLEAVYGEMEREYKHLKDTQPAEPEQIAVNA